MSSRIQTRVNTRGDIQTRTVNNPSGLVVQVESGRYGKEGTELLVGFEGAPNRNLRMSGREARALKRALDKHFGEFVY